MNSQGNMWRRRAVLLAIFLALACGQAPAAPRNAVSPQTRSRAERHPPVVRPQGAGCDRFVSPSGSDANPGTRSAPWRTLERAFDSARPGWTICLRGGTYAATVARGYSQILRRSGTAANPITITNVPGETAIVRGSTRVQADRVKIEGNGAGGGGLIFEGPGAPRLGVMDVMYSHHVTFDHIEIRNGDFHAGFYQYGGSGIKLLDSYIHHNGRPGHINTDQGIYWDKTTGGGNLIAHCLVSHNVSSGIQLYPDTSGVTVEQNTVVDNGNYGIVVYGSGDTIANNILSGNGSVARNPQLKIGRGSNHVITSNLFWSRNPRRRGYYSKTGQRVAHSIVADPRFVDAANHDYRLRPRSPALGAANPRYVPASKISRRASRRTFLGAYGPAPPAGKRPSR